jgi:hypothetical protein
MVLRDWRLFILYSDEQPLFRVSDDCYFIKQLIKVGSGENADIGT